MVQTETSGKTCLDIGEVQPIAVERLRRIDCCVFQSGAKVKIEAGNVEFIGKFTAELGSKVELTQFIDY